MDLLTELKPFGDILQPKASLAPFTLFRLGGPAEVLAQPRTTAELQAIVRHCASKQIPFCVLGAGSNLLIREEGVKGVVLRLSAPEFSQVSVTGTRLKAGGGTTLTALINAASRHGLAGLETLVGAPGSVGGAVRMNAGDRSGEIGQFVRLVEVVDSTGAIQWRERDDLRFSYRSSNLDDPVLLSAEFELEKDSPDAIVKRLRKAWIQRKATQPFSFQAAGRIFKNPRGLSAAGLIEQAGLVGSKVGGAEVSDRNANYIVAGQDSTARDVLRLIDLIRSQVQDRFHVELELELSIW